MSMKQHRSLLEALFFEKDGDLNLSQVFVLLMGLAGTFGFIYQLIYSKNTLTTIAGWSFMAGAFASVLIASIPIAKAKILANSKLPGELAKAIADVGLNDPGISSDIQELTERRQADEIG